MRHWINLTEALNPRHTGFRVPHTGDRIEIAHEPRPLMVIDHARWPREGEDITKERKYDHRRKMLVQCPREEAEFVIVNVWGPMAVPLESIDRHKLGEALRPEAAKTRMPEINDRVRLQGSGFQLVTAYGKRKDGSPTLNPYVYYFSDHDGSTVTVQECPKEEAEFVILNKFWVVEPSRIFANAGQQEIPESIAEALEPRMAKVRVPHMGEVVQLSKFSAMNHNAHYTVTGFTKQDDYRPDQHQWPVRISDMGGIQDTGFVMTSICPREEAEFAILDDKWCVRLADLTFT